MAICAQIKVGGTGAPMADCGYRYIHVLQDILVYIYIYISSSFGLELARCLNFGKAPLGCFGLLNVWMLTISDLPRKRFAGDCGWPAWSSQGRWVCMPGGLILFWQCGIAAATATKAQRGGTLLHWRAVRSQRSGARSFEILPAGSDRGKVLWIGKCLPGMFKMAL